VSDAVLLALAALAPMVSAPEGELLVPVALVSIAIALEGERLVRAAQASIEAKQRVPVEEHA